MHSKQKGNIGQIAVAKFLSSLGYSVFVELGDLSKVDLICLIEERPIKIQVKYCPLKNGRILVPLRKCGPNYTYRYSKNDFDYLAVYCPTNDLVYFVPNSILDTCSAQLILRVDEPKNRQVIGVHLAKDYLHIR